HPERRAARPKQWRLHPACGIEPDERHDGASDEDRERQARDVAVTVVRELMAGVHEPSHRRQDDGVPRVDGESRGPTMGERHHRSGCKRLSGYQSITNRSSGSVITIDFASSASAKVTTDAASSRRRRGASAVTARRYKRRQARNSAPERTSRRSVAHATDSARRGWIAKNIAATAAPARPVVSLAEGVAAVRTRLATQ